MATSRRTPYRAPRAPALWIPVTAVGLLLIAAGWSILESYDPIVDRGNRRVEATLPLAAPSGQRHGRVAGSSWPGPAPAPVAQRLDAPLVMPADAASARPEAPVPEDLIAQALGGGTAEERAAAIDALAYATPDDTGGVDYLTSVLVQSLLDPEGSVRAQALGTLKDRVEDLPVETVAGLVRHDPSPDLRIQALELLVERTGERASEPLRLALADPDPGVRDRAAELAADWHLSLEGG